MKKSSTIHKILKVVFSLFIVVSATGELTFNETVIHSMNVIQMPVYLLPFLGIAKILGLAAIWFAPRTWLKEWAFAGFVFDFIGAIFCFLITDQLIMPDIIMAPVGLVLCISLYVVFKKESSQLVINPHQFINPNPANAARKINP